MTLQLSRATLVLRGISHMRHKFFCVEKVTMQLYVHSIVFIQISPFVQYNPSNYKRTQTYLLLSYLCVVIQLKTITLIFCWATTYVFFLNWRYQICWTISWFDLLFLLYCGSEFSETTFLLFQNRRLNFYNANILEIKLS